MTFFFKKEPSLYTWDGVDGFKIYESFSDSDKLLKNWFSFKMFKKSPSGWKVGLWWLFLFMQRSL
jgi:hypothetical protein